jgi:hypothetical protein
MCVEFPGLGREIYCAKDVKDGMNSLKPEILRTIANPRSTDFILERSCFFVSANVF